MAKDGKSALPSVDDYKGPTVPKPTELPPPPPSGIPEIGAAYPTDGYVPRRVDVKLTRAQAVKLRDKLRLLQDTGAQTADGRFVSNRTQAVQWIIENM
jgi:hypothetical protein